MPAMPLKKAGIIFWKKGEAKAAFSPQKQKKVFFAFFFF